MTANKLLFFLLDVHRFDVLHEIVQVVKAAAAVAPETACSEGPAAPPSPHAGGTPEGVAETGWLDRPRLRHSPLTRSSGR